MHALSRSNTNSRARNPKWIVASLDHLLQCAPALPAGKFCLERMQSIVQETENHDSKSEKILLDAQFTGRFPLCFRRDVLRGELAGLKPFALAIDAEAVTVQKCQGHIIRVNAAIYGLEIDDMVILCMHFRDTCCEIVCYGYSVAIKFR